MGGYVGKYSRSPFSVFNEEKNYPFALMQEGIPVTDDDENDSRIAGFTQMRRVVQLFGEYGTPNSSFNLLESITSNVNNFTVSTLAGPSNTDIEQAGQFFMRGIRCLLMHDVDYENDLGDLAKQSIHPRVTNNYWDDPNTVVEDSAANWVTDELATRTVSFDGGATWHTIASNTSNTFLIAAPDVSATIDNGDHYILRLSTPGGARTDEVYLNVYIDEYDSTDDPTLEKELGGNAVEAQLRAKIIQTIFVREDSPGVGSVSDYVDANGNQHFVSKISTIVRSISAITQLDITNSVAALGGDTSLAQIAPLEAVAQSATPDQVFVKSGQALHSDGTSIVVWPGGTKTFANTDATLDRIDVLVLEDAGTLAIIEGTPHVTPTVPAFYGVPIAIVAIASTAGAAPVITSSDITDARTLFTPATFIDPNDYLGWKLKREIGSDAALSAVTVGESECDFTTIDAAITYVNNLGTAPNVDRQFAVYLFNKREGQDWTISSSITIPEYVHFIGMGKPTLKIAVVTGDAISFGTGSSLKNMNLEVGVSGWTSIITSSAADVDIDNVDIHYEVSATDDDYAVILGAAASGTRINKLRLTPQTGTPANGCRGIFITSGAEKTYITNSDITGTVHSLYASSIQDIFMDNVRFSGTSLNDEHIVYLWSARGTISNMWVTTTGAPSAKAVMRAAGSSANFGLVISNLSINTPDSGPENALFISGLHITNLQINNGYSWMLNSRINGGFVRYSYNDSKPTIEISNNMTLSGLEVSRSVVAAPGIEAAGDTAHDACISGCRVLGTSGVASIRGVTGADDWLVDGNVVDVATSANGGNGWIFGDEKVI